MTIIELAALENGAHRNQTGDFSAIPDGWAVIPRQSRFQIHSRLSIWSQES